MDPNQANDEYLLQLWEAMGKKLPSAGKVVYSYTTSLSVIHLLIKLWELLVMAKDISIIIMEQFWHNSE